nr:FHG22 protein precursor - golden hamster [Mesocricetus auratus]ATV94956.1 heteroglobin a subunit [Mesocricetus auratus]SJL38371.1 Heteroglobin A subunit [Mesocricetus auratus]
MKLSLCLLLVILAVHCYEANAANVCPAVLSVSKSFLFDKVEKFEAYLQTFNAPPEAVKAKVEVKKCIDSTLNYLEKMEMGKILAEVVGYCKGTEN